MGNVIVDENVLHSMALAIREKGRTERRLLPSEMPDAIRNMLYTESAELVAQVEKTINLSRDTTFDSANFSDSTAATIRSAQTNELDMTLPEAIDTEVYDVYGISLTEIEYRYKTGAVLPRGLIQRSISVVKTQKLQRLNNFPFDGNTYTVPLSSPNQTITVYYNLNTANAIVLQTSLSNNSIIANSSAPSLYSSTTPLGGGTSNQSNRYIYRLTWSPSAVTVRGSTSVFSAAAMRDIDSENTNIVRKMYAYKVPKAERGWLDSLVQRMYLLQDVDG